MTNTKSTLESNPTTQNMAELPSRYSPGDVENRIYNFWLERTSFASKDQSTQPPFSMILPPPNVTGSLHLGHALDHTIQDAIIRWKRMSGFNTMWLPGTDHAGIATQMVVERELKKEKLNRKSLGRDKFLEHVWNWKHKSGNQIVEQMKRLGDSCDWSRHTFTMDESVSKAVRRAFVQLHKEKLIYRGTRLVNWDTQLETAVSDLEVEHREVKGSLWHIRYPVETTDKSSKTLIIATTRPETMLGDTAVCVHPDDDRYKDYHGKFVMLPLTQRKIPIICDESVDKEFGSGVVKVTPAHDFTDFQLGQKHKLPTINILNTNGTLNENAGNYSGMGLKEARQKVLEDLAALNFLEKEEPHTHMVPVSDRTGMLIEPFLSQQWFVSIKKLAQPAQRVVESGTIQFVPSSWTKTYLHWMNNIEDWCISRQLWWGHRIPAWHCLDCLSYSVSETDCELCEKCESKNVRQDEDVLDTWFSSGLWPFSTLGWPKNTESFKTFYPTSVLVTGHDIIFFWVARMIMMGLHFTGDVPFRTVYVHGIVRDDQGRKMSKSIGNTLDPLQLIDKHGADSLRFAILAHIATGKDMKFSEQRLEGYRNFMNKIWNAARFSLGALSDFEIPKEGLKALPNRSDLSLADQWIIYRLGQVESEILSSFEGYRFSDAAQSIYGFIWYDLCDWYLEFIKPIIYGDSRSEKKCTQLILSHVLNRTMRLLHPFAPFITEEIYQKLPLKSDLLMTDRYPTPENDQEFLSLSQESAARDMELLKSVIMAIRNIRGENRISPGVEIEVYLAPHEDETQKILGAYKSFIMRFGKVKTCEIAPVKSMSKCAVSRVSVENHKVDVVIPLLGLVDLEEEIRRIEKSIEKIQKEAFGLNQRLENENFVKNAPEEVVLADRERLGQIKSQVEIWEQSLARLKV